MLALTDVWDVAALKRDAIVGLDGLIRPVGGGGRK